MWCFVDPEEAVERQLGWAAVSVGAGLRPISSSELQSHAALREKQRLGAAGKPQAIIANQQVTDLFMNESIV